MDPATGTFTTMDTYGGSLSDPMSLNKYLFANFNPVMNSDPSGHFSLQELGASMAISSILAGACYSSCVIVAAILDASTGSNRLSKYSISGLVYSMLVGFMMGGIAFELGAIFASLGLSFLQYLLISIVCAVIGIGLKYAGDRLKQSDYTGIGIVVSTLGDVGLVAAFAAALSALSTYNNGQKGKNYDQQNCTNTSDSGGRYSGELEKVNKPDPAADALAERIGGESSVKFSNDPAGREFDVVSDKYIGQAKPALKSYGEGWRNQTKATFEAAKATNRTPYFQFEGNPDPSVINKIAEYGQRYGIPYVIDTNPLGVTN